MSRENAIAHAVAAFDDERFYSDLARRVAMPTESQVAGNHAALRAYLEKEMVPAFEAMGFVTRLLGRAGAHGRREGVRLVQFRDSYLRAERLGVPV